jgi:predicted dehydrogenase
MTYRALIVGLGNIGMGYDLGAEPGLRVATLARAFYEHPAFELVGGVDTDSARQELFQKHYARPPFSGIDVAMRETSPDVVAIAVPTEAHYPVFSEVVRLGTPTAILCEKPLSFELAEAEQMVDCAASAEISLFTNYMRRCDPAVIEVRRRIECREISGPLKGVCWYSKGLFNNGSHFLNLFQYWLGDVVDFQVTSTGRLWDGHDPEPDVRVVFEAGEIYFLAAREENFSHYTVELVAANGRLRYEQGQMQWQAVSPDSNNAGYVVLDRAVETLDSDGPRLQWHVAEQMARSLAGSHSSICTGSQGLSTLQALTRIMSEL